MQNRILAVPSTLLVTFALVGAMQACEDRSATGSRSTPDTSGKNHAADNTGRNADNPGSKGATPQDQGESESDRRITADIRKAIMAEKGLSMNAQNCKIITQNGIVTLRGPVETDAERTLIADKARAQSGVTSVVNDLEVKAK